MAIKIECPRCKTRLTAPNQAAGSYAICPHCKGRFWVEKNIQADDAVVEAVAPISDTPTFAFFTPPPPATTPLKSPPPATSPAPPPPPAKTPPAVPPRRGRKKARFIASDAAPSAIQPALDGKLPELQLLDKEGKQNVEKKSPGVNPKVLAGLIAFWIFMAFLFVVTNTDGVPRADRQQCIDARRDIEEHYFGEPGKKDLEPYQIKLREAERAYGRKDFKQERLLYKKVLDMLRAERGPADSGLTGSRSRDKNLEKDVNILLNEE